MKQMLKLSSFVLLTILIVSGCNPKNGEEDIFKFKNSYVGNNSAIGNIVINWIVQSTLKDLNLKQKKNRMALF